ncbi:MAG: hypothetical protein ACJ75H_11445 [Thermoanaerobaculia bacterium]
MSFKSTDLMIDVLPIGWPAQPGLVLCGQITAGGEEEDDEDMDDLECGQITAATGGGNEPTSYTRGQAGLDLLRRQLRHALEASGRP